MQAFVQFGTHIQQHALPHPLHDIRAKYRHQGRGQVDPDERRHNNGEKGGVAGFDHLVDKHLGEIGGHEPQAGDGQRQQQTEGGDPAIGKQMRQQSGDDLAAIDAMNADFTPPTQGAAAAAAAVLRALGDRRGDFLETLAFFPRLDDFVDVVADIGYVMLAAETETGDHMGLVFAGEDHVARGDVGPHLGIGHGVQGDFEVDGRMAAAVILGGKHQVAPVGEEIPAFSEAIVGQNIGIEVRRGIFARFEGRIQPAPDIERQIREARCNPFGAFVFGYILGHEHKCRSRTGSQPDPDRLVISVLAVSSPRFAPAQSCLEPLAGHPHGERARKHERKPIRSKRETNPNRPKKHHFSMIRRIETRCLDSSARLPRGLHVRPWIDVSPASFRFVGRTRAGAEPHRR